jgi:NADPH2:quinone reductase
MRSWQVSEYGEPKDVLRLAEVDEPTADDGQIVVRVRAVAANFPDVLMCRGMYQVRPEFPFTPGIELCGEVTAVGSGVTGPAVGDRVIGSPELATGAYSEQALMTADRAYAAPSALDDAEAASLFVGYQTAYFALHRRAHLQAGETLLVHAAAGGVGSAAVQVGKAAGATVIGVVGGPSKADAARSMGADIVVDRLADDFVAVVKDATGGRGADVVYDPVGGESFDKSTKCIAFEGRIVTLGFTSGVIPKSSLSHPLIKNYSILGLHWGLYSQRDPQAVKDAQETLSRMAQDGTVRPLIDRRLPFEDVPAGVQSLADGKTVGRVTFSPLS